MFSSKKNTIVFWQNKNTMAIGGGSYLYSMDAADDYIIKRINSDTWCKYEAVTLTDKQLEQIADKKSGILLEDFNPFSPKVIFAKQKMTFVLGLFLEDSKEDNGQKNESPLKFVLAQNSLFDTNPIKEILFQFLEPADPSKPKVLSKQKVK